MGISDFVEGRSYESKTHGVVTYKGVDRYMGQLTLKFLSEYGTQYWLPETMVDHFGKES